MAPVDDEGLALIVIQQDDLADARERLRAYNEADVAIFDEALRRAQGLPHAQCDMIETGLVMVCLQKNDLAHHQHMYPFDDPAAAAEMAKEQSECGLATEEIWRAGDVADDRLQMPYMKRWPRGGDLYAVTLERMIAIKHGAWVDAARASSVVLEPTDALIIGCKGCPGVWARNTFTDEHEFTVLYTEVAPDGDSVLVHSVDGGQGRPAIAIRTRWLVEGGGEVWLASLDATITADGRPSKGRRLLGLSRSRLLLRYLILSFHPGHPEGTPPMATRKRAGSKKLSTTTMVLGGLAAVGLLAAVFWPKASDAKDAPPAGPKAGDTCTTTDGHPGTIAADGRTCNAGKV